MSVSEKPKHENISESADQPGEQGNGGEEEKPLEEKKAEWEENPDLEDPRLISPLQEPDRPAPSERIRQESEQEQTPSEENQENF